jgi:23S rRNA pseudouridine1911/1915/1917 synthase
VIVRFKVDARLPPPARTALSLVQAALKVHRTVAAQLIHEGAVRCGGRTVAQTHLKIEVGTEVEIDYAPQPKATPSKKDPSRTTQFEVIHDDEHLIVVNKPANLLTVPTPKREANTLQSRVRTWLAKTQPEAMAICVHRLDRGVSGLLVFAKNYEVADQIRSQFAARKPERQYMAIVAGKLSQASGTFRSYLATDESLSRHSVQDPNGGELAITHYKVRENWGDTTLVEVTLETGRRNQIRVHFAETGHPVLGDPRYRTQEAAHRWWPYKRLALHAETLGLMHPETDQPLRFVSQWPQEFRDFRRKAARPATRPPGPTRSSDRD